MTKPKESNVKTQSGVSTFGRLPRVDAADHVLNQEIGGCVARPSGFRQEEYDQAPHLQVVLAVVDKTPARIKHRRGSFIQPHRYSKWSGCVVLSTVYQEIVLLW